MFTILDKKGSGAGLTQEQQALLNSGFQRVRRDGNRIIFGTHTGEVVFDATDMFHDLKVTGASIQGKQIRLDILGGNNVIIDLEDFALLSELFSGDYNDLLNKPLTIDETVQTSRLTQNFVSGNIIDNLEDLDIVLAVQAGDFIDASTFVYIDYAAYGDIGGQVWITFEMFGAQVNGFTVGAMAGGDNSVESGYCFLTAPYFPVRDGNLTVGVRLRHVTNADKTFVANRNGLVVKRYRR